MNLFLMPRMSREELKSELEGMRRAAAKRLRTKESALATLREIGVIDDDAPVKQAKKTAKRRVK